MKLKVFIVFIFALGYLMLTFGSSVSSAATSVCVSINLSVCRTDPPHAVDISGKPIPDSSTIQPDKPIILANDSLDSSKGPFKTEAAFDHSKHSTDIAYSLDGKTVTGCAECHHTEQPSAPVGQEYAALSSRSACGSAK